MEKIIKKHLKAALPCGDIHGCQVSHVVELSVGVILQEGENRYNPFWMDHYLQLIKAGHLEFKQKDVHERTIESCRVHRQSHLIGNLKTLH